MTLALATVLAACPAAPASPRGNPALEAAVDAMAGRLDARARARELAARAAAAFTAGDFAAAADLFSQQAEAEPGNFVPHYNRACALARVGDVPTAEAALQRAVELGFASLSTLTTDPDLAPLRQGTLYNALINHWPRILDARRPVGLDHARQWLSRKPRELPLPLLRLDLLSGQSEYATALASKSIERVTAWTQAALIPAIAEPGAPNSQNDAWITVIVPDDADFTRWLVWTFGPEAAAGGVSSIGGAYEHDMKRLVARDVGATLRHELFHALHWRHTERLGQRHPIWITEGLASLLEDMDPPATGESLWRPVPSARTNIVHRLAQRDRLTPLAELAALDQRTFATSKPLRRYAEARAVFMYLLERGELQTWYHTYTTDPAHGYAADPTGLKAIEHTAALDLPAFEAAWNDWARTSLTLVAESFDDLTIALPFTLDDGTGDGPRITDMQRGARESTGLRLGDVITAVDNRPTSDIQEFVRVLTAVAPETTVTIDYRRGRLYGTATVPVSERRE